MGVHVGVSNRKVSPTHSLILVKLTLIPLYCVHFLYSIFEYYDSVESMMSQISLSLSRAFVDARIQPIYGGTNEIMKELIARTIVGPN